MKLIREIRCKKGSKYNLCEKNGDYFIQNYTGQTVSITKQDGQTLLMMDKPQRKSVALFNGRSFYFGQASGTFNLNKFESQQERGLRWLSCVNS